MLLVLLLNRLLLQLFFLHFTSLFLFFLPLLKQVSLFGPPIAFLTLSARATWPPFAHPATGRAAPACSRSLTFFLATSPLLQATSEKSLHSSFLLALAISLLGQVHPFVTTTLLSGAPHHQLSVATYRSLRFTPLSTSAQSITRFYNV